MAVGNEAAKKDERTLLGVTPGGKEIYYARKHGASIRFVEFGTGGQKPLQLQGGFGSVRAAKEAVDAYLDLMEQKLIREDGTEIKAKAKAK